MKHKYGTRSGAVDPDDAAPVVVASLHAVLPGLGQERDGRAQPGGARVVVALQAHHAAALLVPLLHAVLGARRWQECVQRARARGAVGVGLGWVRRHALDGDHAAAVLVLGGAEGVS